MIIIIDPILYPQILNISRLQQPRFGILPLRQLQAPQVAAAQRLQGLRQQVLRLAKADFATEKVGISVDFPGESDGIHGSLNVPIEHHPTIRYMVYNGYYKVMSNIPKMGQLPTPGIH